MTIKNQAHLQTQVQERLLQHVGSVFKVEDTGDDSATIITPFMYPYEDPIMLYVKRTGEDSYRISDHGETRYWINVVNMFCTDRELDISDREIWDLNCWFFQIMRTEYDHLQASADSENICVVAFRVLQAIIHMLGPEPRDGKCDCDNCPKWRR